jgi:hypothetical protein
MGEPLEPGNMGAINQGNQSGSVSNEILVNQSHEELRAAPRPDLVAKYQLFDKMVNPPKDVVYHPCGSDDVSPSVVFPNSRVIYVELDEQAVNALQKGGFEAHHASALEYDPGDVDILIMLNPAISPEAPAVHVREGGYVVCNDYHATATTLRKNSDFQLKGLIRMTKDKGLTYDTDHPENYWTEVDSDEEFRNASFDFASADYASAANVVEALTGKRENVLVEYRRIIAEEIERERQENALTLAEHPELAGSLSDSNVGVIILNHGEKQFILSTRLPRKKGTVDDLFVFERVTKAQPQTDQTVIVENPILAKEEKLQNTGESLYPNVQLAIDDLKRIVSESAKTIDIPHTSHGEPILPFEIMQKWFDEEGFGNNIRGTYHNADTYIYFKSCNIIRKEEDIDQAIATARHLTKMGAIHPKSQWGIYKTRDDVYQLFVVSPKLEPWLLNKELLGEYDSRPNRPMQDESHLLAWYKKIDPNFVPGQPIPENSLLYHLNWTEASNHNNWGWDVEGEIFPIDVEVLDPSRVSKDREPWKPKVYNTALSDLI